MGTMVPVNGFPSAHRLLRQSIPFRRQEEPILAFLYATGAANEHRRHHLCVCREHPFLPLKAGCLVAAQHVMTSTSTPCQPFCGDAHSLISKVQKCPHAEQDWEPLFTSHVKSCISLQQKSKS